MFLSLRGHFSVYALEHISSHSPCKGKSSQQDVLPTETLTVYVILNQIYVPPPPPALCDTHSTSDILPPPPHTVNPLGSQSAWSLSHLPIMQASWRWSGSVEKESTRYELWDRLNCAVHLRPEREKIWGEIMCCAPALQLSSSHLALPLHTLLASKTLSFPLARNHLRGLFHIAKAFDCLCLKQCTKAGFFFFPSLKTAHCVGFVRRSLHGERREESEAIRGRVSSRRPVVRSWKSHVHTSTPASLSHEAADKNTHSASQCLHESCYCCRRHYMFMYPWDLFHYRVTKACWILLSPHRSDHEIQHYTILVNNGFTVQNKSCNPVCVPLI